MPLNAAALQVGAAPMAAAIGFFALHTAAPNSSGSNEATSSRVASGLTSTAGVISTSTPKNFTGGASNGPVLYVGYWSALTGGVFYGYQALTGDNTFNSLGQFTLQSVTITGSAS